jgi:enamine deaminase RidA (YjgF/YER057c/UK114 family)
MEVAMGHEERARAAGVDLDMTLLRAGNFDLVVQTGNVVYVAGCIALADGGIAFKGRLGADMDIPEGQRSARGAAEAILAAVHQYLGSLDRVERVVRLTAYVTSAAGFGDQPKVVNGASDLMIDVFGDSGRHARSAIGVAELPLGASVEIEGIFQVSAESA